jgi:hypothetical protein
MTVRTLLMGAVVMFAAGPALAQSSNFVLLGTISAVADGKISVEPATGGAAQTVTLAPDAGVFTSRPATLADIKATDYVASAAIKGTDGKLHSTELRIWPDALRGLGEGQFPMNDPKHQTMTNATVTGTAIVGSSNDLTVSFKGRQSELVVDPGVPVSKVEQVAVSTLKPGVKVRVGGTKGSDGDVAKRIFVQ